MNEGTKTPVSVAKNRSLLASVQAYRNVWPKLAESVFLADGARVVGDVELGENCSVWFNAVVRGDVNSIRIGARTNIQDGAIIHCTYQKFSTTLGSDVSIGHNAIVHGAVVEDGCLVGMNAVIMDGVVIGRQSIVGAGALVTQGTQVPPRSLVLGSPARVVRPLRDEEIDACLATSLRYIEYCNGYSFS